MKHWAVNTGARSMLRAESRGVAQRRPLAHVVAFGRLDLQDVGAHVGAEARAVRAGQHDREIEHPEAGERIAARRASGRRHGEAAAGQPPARTGSRLVDASAKGSSRRCTEARWVRIRRVASSASRARSAARKARRFSTSLGCGLPPAATRP